MIVMPSISFAMIMVDGEVAGGMQKAYYRCLRKGSRSLCLNMSFIEILLLILELFSRIMFVFKVTKTRL
jgi:hypothetical protein